MFKSSPFSFIWGTKSAPSTTETNSKASHVGTKGAQAFTITGVGSGPVKVSMVDGGEDDGFVDILCRKLSYAEVASLSKKPPQLATPAMGRIEQNGFEVLRTAEKEQLSTSIYSCEINDELSEKLKRHTHFSNKKHKKNGKKPKSK